MEKNLIINLINILSLGVIILLASSSSSLVELNPYLFIINNWSEPSPIINLLSNSYHNWSFDPLLQGLLLNYQNPVLILIYSLFFLTLGWFLLFRKYLENQEQLNYANLLSLILTVCLLTTLSLIYQIDYVLLTTFTWIPFFILATNNFLANKFTSILYLLFASILLIFSSNQLSLLLISFLLGILLLRPSVESKIRQSYQTIIFFLILLGSFCYLIYYPETIFLDYGINQRVLTKDYFAGIAHPLFGPSSPIKLLDFDNIRTILSAVIPALFLFSLCLLPILKKNSAVYLLIILNLVLLLDLHTNYELKHILPLETIGRLIPQNSFFPLAVSLSVLSIFTTCYLLIANKKFFFVLPFLAFLLSAHFLSNQNTNLALTKIKALKANSFSIDQKLINSPAAQLIINNLDINFERLRRNQNKTYRSIKRLQPKLTASHNPEELNLLIDKDLVTNWTTKSGQQTGKEWLKMEFPEEITVHGLEFGSGKRHADFPRGLKISAATNFDEQEEVIFHDDSWTGSLAFTKLGYPYYTHESKVKIIFAKRTLKCLKIEQTGITPHFEWAINEIKYLK